MNPSRLFILRPVATALTMVAILLAGLNDSDTETRRFACESLGRRGGPESVRELSRVATSDADADVRLAAVKGLGYTRDRAALAPLAEALADSNPAMQYRAQESLRAVSGRDFGADVQAWREYAQSGNTEAPEVNLVERLRRSLF